VKASRDDRTHDVKVWNFSQLSRHMLREYKNGRQNMWLSMCNKYVHNVQILNFYL